MTISETSTDIAQALTTLMLLDSSNYSQKGFPVVDPVSGMSASQLAAMISLSLADLVCMKEKDENDLKSINRILEITIPKLTSIINTLGDKFEKIQYINIISENLVKTIQELDQLKWRKHKNALILLFTAIYEEANWSKNAKKEKTT